MGQHTGVFRAYTARWIVAVSRHWRVVRASWGACWLIGGVGGDVCNAPLPCWCVQSVHSEVDRRCRAIGESLGRYLGVMRCVTADDVLAARRRIQHARAKADNVAIISANRSTTTTHDWRRQIRATRRLQHFVSYANKS